MENLKSPVYNTFPWEPSNKNLQHGQKQVQALNGQVVTSWASHTHCLNFMMPHEFRRSWRVGLTWQSQDSDPQGATWPQDLPSDKQTTGSGEKESEGNKCYTKIQQNNKKKGQFCVWFIDKMMDMCEKFKLFTSPDASSTREICVGLSSSKGTSNKSEIRTEIRRKGLKWMERNSSIRSFFGCEICVTLGKRSRDPEWQKIQKTCFLNIQQYLRKPRNSCA